MASAAQRDDIGHHRLKDPYQYHPEDVEVPPRSFAAALRRIGPGMILSASIVGSGELIATTTLGAEVGYTALWIIIFSCLAKPAVQSLLGRYTIATGSTGFGALNQVPGPRAKLNWVVWFGALMIVMTFFQLGAMFGGVSQVLNQLMPAIPVQAWVLFLLVVSLALLLGGGYTRIEGLATLKVALFTMLTFFCAAILVQQPTGFSWSEVAAGLKFQLPGAGLATAVAVFGITGVGTNELFMYPYWCVEKGYARYTGPRDGSPEWSARAAGWIRVMNLDILASMVIYTVATIAFYMLGAGILNKRGMVPEAGNMISVLSNMYTETLGPWALYLFYAGAIATLYGTIFASTAANSRIFADMAQMLGAFGRGDYASRLRWRNRFIWFILSVPAGLILFFESPVNMVRLGGTAQALMLPIVAISALYLRHRRLPVEVRPNAIQTTGLWISVVLIVALMGYYAYLTIK
jgi:manganese transport protein